MVEMGMRNKHRIQVGYIAVVKEVESFGMPASLEYTAINQYPAFTCFYQISRAGDFPATGPENFDLHLLRTH